MKKACKRTLIILLALVILIGAAVGGLYLHSQNYSVPAPAATAENNTGLVQAVGRGLYDAEGNVLQLIGVNAGQILAQEGWMSVFSLEPMKNKDGSYVKDEGGNIQYPEFAEEAFRNGLASNPNLAGYDIDDLMAYYWTCFFTEEDFRIIKEDLELNTIRLPFYWRNLLNDDLTLKDEEAFWYLDWFISMAAKYELYIVLDLHGAPGSQNGFEHSGTETVGYAGFWENPDYVNSVIELWDLVSHHYTVSRPELGKWIAAYDILNEPTYRYAGLTNKKCWEVFDRLYDTIRENGDNHVVIMEGCWDFATMPDPADYGWENVMYEYHLYNWKNNIISYEWFMTYYDFTNIGRDYDVPVFIGEFTCFEDKEAWDKMLTLFDDRSYNWTIWNYKTCVTGWWTSSWGVYTCQMKAITENEDTKCNVATCTYEEFIAACELTQTENCATGTLYEVLQSYKEGN